MVLAEDPLARRREQRAQAHGWRGSGDWERAPSKARASDITQEQGRPGDLENGGEKFTLTVVDSGKPSTSSNHQSVFCKPQLICQKLPSLRKK